MLRRLTVGALLVVLGVAVARLLPDAIRYLKIRTM
jgi:hypothetical protein